MTTDPAADALLPCPFCGSPAGMERPHTGSTMVFCSNAECATHPSTGWCYDEHLNAAAEWNRRDGAKPGPAGECRPGMNWRDAETANLMAERDAAIDERCKLQDEMSEVYPPLDQVGFVAGLKALVKERDAAVARAEKAEDDLKSRREAIAYAQREMASAGYDDAAPIEALARSAASTMKKLAAAEKERDRMREALRQLILFCENTCDCGKDIHGVDRPWMTKAKAALGAPGGDGMEG